MAAIVSLLVVVFVSMLITRIATIALAATGMSRESARFQARSALTGAGFTTSESEAIVRHPVRRRIVMMLMLIGSAGIAAVIGTIVLAFVRPDEADTWGIRLAVLALGIGALWLFATSTWIDRWITRATMWALRRYTSIDVRDYASLLHLGGDYVITEFLVPSGHWLADRTLDQLALRKEGVIVLGVTRPEGDYVGVPKGDTLIRAGDLLVLYSRTGQLDELDRRRRGAAGERAHDRAVHEHRAEVREQGDRAPTAAGTPSARSARMADARQSPLPQDRVAENIDQRQRAKDAKEEQRMQERYLKEQGVDERPGTNPREQPGIPDEPKGPAEGGD